MTNLAVDASDVLNFMIIRLAFIAGGIVLLVGLVVLLILALRRRGRLDQAKQFVEPVARGWAERGGPVRRGATRSVLKYLDSDGQKRS